MTFIVENVSGEHACITFGFDGDPLEPTQRGRARLRVPELRKGGGIDSFVPDLPYRADGGQ